MMPGEAVLEGPKLKRKTPSGVVGRGCPWLLAGLCSFLDSTVEQLRSLQDQLDQGSNPGLNACCCVTLGSCLTSLSPSLSLENEGKQ